MHVICLCAQWCRLCNDYRKTFDALASSHSAQHCAFTELEKEADLLDLICVLNLRLKKEVRSILARALSGHACSTI